MKKTVNCLIISGSIVMGLGLSSCATSGYLADRNNDLKDVFTVEVGYGLGARVRAGSMHVGLAGAVSTLGLSNGEFFQNIPNHMTEEECPTVVELTSTSVEYSPKGRLNKPYRVRWSQPLVSSPEGLPLGDGTSRATKGIHPYYSELRITVAAGAALTLGFNVGEFADYIMGWFHYDIYGDDYATLKPSGINDESR